MQSLCILGRQPALGIAELESLYGAAAVHVVDTGAALLDIAPSDVAFDRLGGSIKLAKVLTILDTTDWRKIEKYLVQTVPQHLEYLPEGKIQLGLSTYGITGITTGQLLATGLTLKKVIKKAGRSVRLVPNTELALNSASVQHNNLTGPTGWELLLSRFGSQTILAQTIAVQNIASYTQRDRGRPKRDARVGMLPPKLAQIIVNLAACTTPPSSDYTILDPFCGTGVVLQEAGLMGFAVYGTDIDERMIRYSRDNMSWVQDELGVNLQANLEVGDATSHRWSAAVNAVACETYLGKPFTTPPPPDVLAQTASECNLIIKKFLRNIGEQLAPGIRLCLAVPAWQTRPGQFKHLPLLDSLTDMGYNRISFEHVRSEDLLYYRTDQIVARELLVLTRN